MTIRLSGNDRKAIAAQLKSDIDLACQSHYSDAPRKHLGASEIGEKCLRRLVYSFRWMDFETHSGQLLRLFNHGHVSEPRMIEWLQLAGAQALAVDAGGNQFRMYDRVNHFGGSFDGKVTLPSKYNLPFEFLLEMKTHNAKSFAKLEKEGVKISKPKHYAQICMYGTARNYDYAIYFALCKNDDEIYIEIVDIDKSLGKQLEAKAVTVIQSDALPGKIAASDAFLECKFCSKVDICQRGKPVTINCRSCANAKPIMNSEWFCNKFQNLIPDEFIIKGCPQWVEFNK